MPVEYDVTVEKYVIMPNHVHLIMVLHNLVQERQKSLSDILCVLKSRTTKLANEFEKQHGRQIWQRSFHDHIIRDEKDYLKIWQYIDENPKKWEQDCFYQRESLEILKQDPE